MATHYLLVPTLCLALGSSAQNLNNVLFDPNPIHECELVDLTLIGNYPSGNYSAQSYTFDPVTFTLEFFATGTGTSPQTAFSEPIPPLGPWDPGTYFFTAHLNLNGNIVDTWTTGNLTVLPQIQHDPGIDTFADVCDSGPPTPLLTLLDGTPDPGGQWFDPLGLPHSNTFVPGVDQAGGWLYQFAAPLPCHTDTSAQLFISYLPNSDPGANGIVSICVLSAPVPLFDYLNGTPDPGGTWTGPSPTSGNYDPATMTPGVYTYTVPGIAPCPGPSATVTVTEAAANNAGTGTSAQVCSDLTDVPLSTYLSGGPDQTGAWVDPIGFAFGNYAATFNAQEDFQGTYLYIVANGICPPDTAFVDISLLPNTSAGTGTTFNICVTSGLVDLFDELLGLPDAGGTWTAPGGGTFDGTYDPVIDVPGPYVYTVDGLPPCPDPSATIVVVEQPLSYAGTGDSAWICILDTQAELYYHLTGGPQTTGYWFTPNGDTLGTYTATINGVVNDPGVYTYVVNNAPCAPDSAFVVVTILPTPCAIGFVEHDGGIAHLSVSPNPSDGTINVEIQLVRMSSELALEVMNMNGQVVHRQPVIFSTTALQGTLDLSSLPAGPYLLRLISADGMAVQRFMLH